MSAHTQELEKRITALEKRNKRVELDKGWETSIERRVLLIVFTYISICAYMWVIGVASPWLNAVIPSLGFLLSTLTLPFFKRAWMMKKGVAHEH
jgi:hypothetical protein